MLSRSAGLFQDGSFSFPSAWKHKGFFSEIYCKNLVSFLEVKKKCEGPPVNDGTLRVFNSQICPHWASSSDSVNYPWGFPTSTLVSVVFCLSKPWLPVFASLFLQFWGKWFALCPHLSHRSKKSCWFFSLFSCLLVRIEWWLPSSLHVKLEVPHILSESNSCTQYSCMTLKYSNLLNEGANFFFLRGLVIWSIFEMRVISLHILDEAQERSWRAFAKNKDSEQSCEYVIIFNSIKMKSVYSFHANFASLWVHAKMKCMFCISNQS